jgi:hypothetical protein
MATAVVCAMAPETPRHIMDAPIHERNAVVLNALFCMTYPLKIDLASFRKDTSNLI